MPSSGWSPYPGARKPQPPLGPVPDGRVVGIGAICDLRPPPPAQPGSKSFSVSEFVRLQDGRCVLLHQDRGFTVSPLLGPGGRVVSTDHRGTAESITESVLTTVLPDDDEEAQLEAHPWTWLAGLAQARGLTVTPDQLRRLDYEVVLTDKLERWLAGD